jgi:hypothetical protein
LSQENNVHIANLWAAFNQAPSKIKLEEKLKKWASPPSATEIEKCERAVRMVTAAIKADTVLNKADISVYAKGSFYNRTNIPSDSDVDVAVTLNPLFFNTYPEGMNNSDFNFSPYNYSYSQFKTQVATAIENHFGRTNTTVGDKAILVHENSSRLDADVVPQYVHRRYYQDRSYHEGVALKTTSGDLIYNWPAQDYASGVQKNKATNMKYKDIVRILKNIKGEMELKKYSSASKAKSYLIASLVWNIPDAIFQQDTYVEIIEDCLLFLNYQTSDANNVKHWTEVNELKYLFRPTQPWRLDETNQFSVDALNFFRGLK